MAACGGIEHIFEKPLPESPTLLESLSPWKHINSIKSIGDPSFAEIFRELHFNEKNHVNESSPPSSSPASSLSSNSTFWAGVNSPQKGIDVPRTDLNGSSSNHQDKDRSSTSSYYLSGQKKHYRHSDSFSSMNSESLSLCTEGLGFESFDDVDDLLKNDICDNEWQKQERRRSLPLPRNTTHTENHCSEYKRSRSCRGAFPPPISCIGSSGKPWVCFQSYRQDGRFILKEIRIPTQEFLHAWRENGRLKLQFIQSDDEILEEKHEEEDAEDEGNIEEQNEDTGNNNDDDDVDGDDDNKQDHCRNGQEGRNGGENVETT